jgi:hypothetical protein
VGSFWLDINTQNQYNGSMALIAEYNLEQYDVKP